MTASYPYGYPDKDKRGGAGGCSTHECDRPLRARGLCATCYHRARQAGMPTVLDLRPVYERVMSRLVAEGDCLVYNGARNPRGYGHLANRGRMAYTHRVVYEHHHGTAPAGMVVMHICDNPPCCNIDHLRLGTTSDNVRDCIAKGRHFTPFALKAVKS